MTPKKKDTEVPETPVQSEEVRDAILQKSSAGIGTAIGQLKIEKTREPIEGDDRGSKVPIVGTFDKGDAIEGAEPQGAQTLPSIITVNGTVPVNMIGTPSGPVPVSAVESDPAKGAQLIQERLDADEKEILRTGYAKLSRSKVESMGGADLRAVASDRGYDVGQAGNRQTRARFLRLQAEDKNFESDEEIDGNDTGAPAREGVGQ